jgi:hypothetical protein
VTVSARIVSNIPSQLTIATTGPTRLIKQDRVITRKDIMDALADDMELFG